MIFSFVRGRKRKISRQARTAKVNEVATLIIADTTDLTSDYVCLQLKERGVSYFRLNKDKLSCHSIQLDLVERSLKIGYQDRLYSVNDRALKSVYFRAPTYLRETFSRARTADDQLSRSQWMAFVRNLILFHECVWVNDPVSTYRAENKLYQLAAATELGFKVPVTTVLNYGAAMIDRDRAYIVKSVDTAIF